MMDEMTLLRDAFAADGEVPDGAETRARAALLNHMHHRPVRPRVRRRVIALTAAVAAAAAIAVVIGHTGAPPAVEHRPAAGSPPTAGPGPEPSALPYLQPVSNQQYLENAAWTVDRQAWTYPQPTQYMYKAVQHVINDGAPNGPVYRGTWHTVLDEQWMRVDGLEFGTRRDHGRLTVLKNGAGYLHLPYDEFAALDTPEKVLYYEAHPTGSDGIVIDRLLEQLVLPPKVQAAVFRAIAQSAHGTERPDAVNLDGRPAVALTFTEEGYAQHELLFDQKTYDLIGTRTVVVADHPGDGHTYKKGDVLDEETFTSSKIVDTMGATN
jgi:hypothetical protein